MAGGPMPIQHHKKSDVTKVLEILKDRVSNNDRDVMAALSDTNREEVDPSIGDPHAYLLSHLNRAIHFVDSEEYFDGEAFHSRHPLAALAQEHLSTTAKKVIHGDAGDVLPAAVDVFGEGIQLFGFRDGQYTPRIPQTESRFQGGDRGEKLYPNTRQVYDRSSRRLGSG